MFDNAFQKKLCTGLVSIPSEGVFLQSSNARYSDCPESWHLENNILTVLTAFSAFPFDWVRKSHVENPTALQKWQTNLMQTEVHYLI